MFRFFNQGDKDRSSEQPKPDALNETATRIAIEIIEGKGGELYLKSMKRIFKKTPEMIEDVDPEYREKLKEVLDRDNS